ncbi:hypothetical protein [Streptomyces sp. NPDC006879]|uniref:hypothetical protein n=1 Tax=Streptomyces sp. NPDC006879 TaxID=3364767 RepID=UPI0036B09DFB
MKRTLTALGLAGAALALCPVPALADGPADVVPTVKDAVANTGEKLKDPQAVVQDTQYALGVATTALNQSAEGTDTALAGAGGGLENGTPARLPIGG